MRLESSILQVLMDSKNSQLHMIDLAKKLLILEGYTPTEERVRGLLRSMGPPMEILRVTRMIRLDGRTVIAIRLN